MIRKMLWTLPLILCVILVGCVGQVEPTAEQIKADLIGSQLPGTPWTFEALSEYEQFDIRAKQIQGNALEYDVSMRLVDMASDTHFLADVLIVYKKIDGKWELVSIVPKVFKPISNDPTSKTVIGGQRNEKS
ncbi:hypothetical protein ACFLT8_06095 [Chloroflexota bacterium]